MFLHVETSKESFPLVATSQNMRKPLRLSQSESCFHATIRNFQIKRAMLADDVILSCCHGGFYHVHLYWGQFFLIETRVEIMAQKW